MTQSSPFEIRGVVEGFYGVYYTPAERIDLIRFLGESGFNLYIYGPKNDRQHRARWQEPYPESTMKHLSEAAEAARQAGITFCYAIGSGVSMSYASEKDFRYITDKFKAFHDRGIRSFSILLDDISSEFRHEADAKAYRSFAEAHADVSNRLFRWLKVLDPSCTLSMCPTDYHGPPPFGQYLIELGEKLDPGIDMFYTGAEICSPSIGTEETAKFAETARRKPILWDNYPVNDLAMRPELHIGPIRGRDAGLPQTVKGFAVNTMQEAEASKIALCTFADYFADPQAYDPADSWERALKKIGGEESYPHLKRFAENSLASCLHVREAAKVEELSHTALNALLRGQSASCPELKALNDYLFEVDESCYHLKNRMENTALRNNLLPWIEKMEHWYWMTKRATAVLEAIEQGEDFKHPLHLMKETLSDLERHPKRIAGNWLMPLAHYVLNRAEAVREGRV